MGGAYKMGDVQCTHPRRTRGSSSNAREGVKEGTEGRFRKLGRSIRPCFEFTLVFSFLLSFRARLSFESPSHPSSPTSLSIHPCVYIYIYIHTHLTSRSNRRRPALSVSVDLLVTPSHPLRIPSTTAIAQLDAQSDRSSIVRDDTRKRNCV